MEPETSNQRSAAIAKARKALALLLKMVLFPVGVIVLAMAYMAVAEHSFTQTVGTEIPSDFPLVVVAQKEGKTSAYMIRYGLLNAFTEKFPDSTFRIAPERLREFQLSINRNTKDLFADNEWYPAPFYAAFSMKEGGDGSQLFRASMPPDDDYETRGWYRVADSEIEARHFLSYRGIGPAFFAFVTSFITMLTIYIALPVWRRVSRFKPRQRKGQEAQPK